MDTCGKGHNDWRIRSNGRRECRSCQREYRQSKVRADISYETRSPSVWNQAHVAKLRHLHETGRLVEYVDRLLMKNRQIARFHRQW